MKLKIFRKHALNGKKAQFFSLIIFIILLIIIIIFGIKTALLQTEDSFNVNRLEKTIMNNFVYDFDKTYVEQIIQTSLKPAVASVLNHSSRASKLELLAIMNGTNAGYMDSTLTIPSNLRKVLGTLTFSLDNPDNILNVTLEQIDQTQPNQLIFTFVADYRFELYGSVWEKKGKQIIIPMDIYSLKHPAYGYKYIETNWLVDNNATQCFSNQVFTDAETCTHNNYNLRPPLSIDLV